MIVSLKPVNLKENVSEYVYKVLNKCIGSFKLLGLYRPNITVFEPK